MTNNWETVETCIEMKRILIQECMLLVDAAKRALEDKKWYCEEYEHYVRLGRGSSKEAERCLNEVRRRDEEFNRHLIEAHLCLLGAAKVYLKGIDYTRRMFGNLH